MLSYLSPELQLLHLKNEENIDNAGLTMGAKTQMEIISFGVLQQEGRLEGFITSSIFYEDIDERSLEAGDYDLFSAHVLKYHTEQH